MTTWNFGQPLHIVEIFISICYNACQKSLEHLGHFFIIRTSNHSYQVQMPPRPRNNVDFESYCPSIPAESRIVLTSRISDHKTTLFQGGEGEIAKQGKISGGVPRLLAGIVGFHNLFTADKETVATFLNEMCGT